MSLENDYKQYQKSLEIEGEEIEETFYCDHCGDEFAESEKYFEDGESLCYDCFYYPKL